MPAQNGGGDNGGSAATSTNAGNDPGSAATSTAAGNAPGSATTSSVDPNNSSTATSSSSAPSLTAPPDASSQTGSLNSGSSIPISIPTSIPLNPSESSQLNSLISANPSQASQVSSFLSAHPSITLPSPDTPLPTAANLNGTYGDYENAVSNNWGSCLDPLGIPIILQMGPQWVTDGCNPGFLCKNNSLAHLPEFCPPPPIAMNARLAGGTTPPLGWYEPVICDPGYYCPINASTEILCPEGYYCRQGSFEPTKCSPGASCPAGSKYDMTLLPLVFLIIIDLALISGVVFKKLRARMARRAEHHKTKPKPTQSPFGPGKGRYVPLGENDGLGMEEGDIAMEARITSFRRRPTGFEQLHELDAGISIQDHFLQTPQIGSKASPGAPEESSDLHLFVRSLSRCLGRNSFGLSFEFENLSFKPPKSEKLILSEVSGNINAGSLWGVMGASGAGKSTFVNVLMGKTAHTGGVTKVNGVPGNISKYRKIIGYVPQDDIVLPELTVRENILHSARIRLPANWTDKEIQHHVDILISCLNLSHVRDSLVGSTAAPVISGGQRKRVSIGMELAAAPMALFLDEPTSGLDATAAASIMSTLKALSRLGMTIVTIIHQPRQEIFESMDSLVLLGAGRMIYIGPEKGIQPHFEGLGFHFPEHSNPADTMGDIIAGEGHLYKKHGDAGIFPLIEYWHNKQAASLRDREGVKSPVVSIEEVTNLASTIKLRGAPWYRQIILCFNRSVVQQYRMKSSFFFELGVGALAGFLIGLAELSSHGQNFRGIFHPPYDILSSSIDYANVPQMALLVGLAIGLTASAPGVKIFGEEKLVYWREAAAGHNRFAYYVGKVLSTLPRMFLACFHFTTLFLLLSTPRIPWINAFGANLLYFWCIYGLASCISMATRREDGPLLAVMSSLIVGVLNGMSPQLSKVRKWHMVWLWRASPGTWLAEAYFDQNVSPLAYLYQIEQAQKGIGYDLGAFGLDLGLLFAIGMIYRIVAFLGLRFMFPSKQR